MNASTSAERVRWSHVVYGVVIALVAALLKMSAAQAAQPQADVRLLFESDRGVTIGGWAYDPDTPYESVYVDVSVDGRFVQKVSASSNSSWVQPPQGVPANRSFEMSFMPVHSGRTTICLSIRDSDGVSGVAQICKDIEVSASSRWDSPKGDMRLSPPTSTGATGQLSINGYAYDGNDLAEPIVVVVVIDGQWVEYSYAQRELPPYAPDGTPQGHGFWLFPTVSKPGTHDVCVYMINVGDGENAFAGCAKFTWSPNLPQVRGDMGAYSAGSAIITQGWAFDEMNAGLTMRIMLTVDGDVRAFFHADKPSPELYPYGVGGNHGFVAGFYTSPGKHQVCQFVVSVGSRSALTKCVDVWVG